MYKYNCVLDEETNQIKVFDEDNTQIGGARVYVEDSVARLDNITMDEDRVNSHIVFISLLCTKTKSLLNDKGLNIQSVLCGGINEVNAYDDKIFEALRNKSKQANKR